ncbi:Syntaxin-10 [Clonorchis sinensis]|uniref:Syntaxin 6 n=2 Tax=Clonorchis sinensis TaxID=79923 RepID=H2KU55_CLOSI|nr:Syntaxin-10 [Clonorchis sinensis]GAA34101.1 syntaxin 6 [Clonorchis sinensis]
MSTDYTDPYYTVQDEVIKNLESARTLYQDWLNADLPKNLQELSDNLRQLLRSIEWDLEDIQETVSIVEGNPSRFQLSEKDVAARRQFLRETRDIVNSVKSQLQDAGKREANGPPISFKVTIARPVTNGSGPNRNPVSQPLRTTDTRPIAFPVPSDPLTEQKHLLRQQDERIDQIGASISTLKGMSRRIGDELEDQVALLDDFSNEMTHTETKLDAATKRTARLLHLSTSRRQWWAIGCLSVTLFVILILLVVL